MKPGTIVVCLPCNISEYGRSLAKWIPVADEKTPYMIREIVKIVSNDGILFEEGIIGHLSTGLEISWDIQYVREILPPGTISEEIQEVLDEHLLIPLNQ